MKWFICGHAILHTHITTAPIRSTDHSTDPPKTTTKIRARPSAAFWRWASGRAPTSPTIPRAAPSQVRDTDADRRIIPTIHVSIINHRTTRVQHPHLINVGIDPNLKRDRDALAVAQRKARDRGVELRVQEAAAEALPFPDGSFDAVVSTLVFCTVRCFLCVAVLRCVRVCLQSDCRGDIRYIAPFPAAQPDHTNPHTHQKIKQVRDPPKALQEVSRVLRPGGKFIFIEHIIGEEGSFLRAQHEALDPLQQLLAGGCHLTRATDRLFVGAAGGGSGDGLFSGVEQLTYLEQGSKWPIVRQVGGVLVK